MADPIPNYVPKLEFTGKSTATTYHFSRDPRGFGWALASVNDQTGELLIMSDWGHWSHRWNVTPSALGAPSLTHFIAGRDTANYIADKLTGRRGGDKPLREEFDLDATVKAFRGLICERRLEEGRRTIDGARPTRRHLTAVIARELYDDLDYVADIRDADHFFAEKIDSGSDYQLVGEELYEFLEYKPTTSYMVLLHAIVPAVIEACRAELATKAVACG